MDRKIGVGTRCRGNHRPRDLLRAKGWDPVPGRASRPPVLARWSSVRFGFGVRGCIESGRSTRPGRPAQSAVFAGRWRRANRNVSRLTLRGHSRNGCAAVRSGRTLRHVHPHGARAWSSPRAGRLGAVAAGIHKPDAQRYRSNEERSDRVSSNFNELASRGAQVKSQFPCVGLRLSDEFRAPRRPQIVVASDVSYPKVQKDAQDVLITQRCSKHFRLVVRAATTSGLSSVGPPPTIISQIPEFFSGHSVALLPPTNPLRSKLARDDFACRLVRRSRTWNR
jgi:hypothetical protein